MKSTTLTVLFIFHLTKLRMTIARNDPNLTDVPFKISKSNSISNEPKEDLRYTTKAPNPQLTFVREKLSWINAIKYCRDRGLIMESNETEIRKWLTKHNETEVWLGKYKEYTEWAYIKGCYSVNIDQNARPSNVSDKLLCQKICNDQRNFGIKDNVCVCLQNVLRLTRCACNDPNCVTIWEHRLQPFQYSQSQPYQCISIENCVRKYADCKKKHYSICDDGTHLTYAGGDQIKSAKLCYDRESFLKWYTASDCSKLGVRPHWTSGRREQNTFQLNKYNDDIVVDRLLKCYTIDKRKEEKHSQSKCKTMENYFFCRGANSNDVLKPALVVLHKTENSSSTTVVVGVVIAVLIILVVIVISVVLVKRRKKQTDHSAQSSNKVKVSSSSRKSVDISNPTYNVHNSSIENIQLKVSNELIPDRTVPSPNGNATSNYSLAKPITSNCNTANYCLAQPMEAESDYVYNSDYDHLNSSLKYTQDSDYSVSCHTKVINDDKVGTYDHLSSFEKNDDSDGFNSNYDHLPTNTGTDPTYDVSGRVTHDDNDKYDHLPPNC